MNAAIELVRELQAFTEATKELIEALAQTGAEFDRLNRWAAEEYHRQCEKDPGLEAAWRAAREVDPCIGWLDVAVTREAIR